MGKSYAMDADPKQKVIIVLIGPKGSGKTHIGTLLERKYGLLETCYSRIKKRAASTYIPISDELIKSINEKAAKVDLKWHLTIDNSDQLSDEKISGMFRSLLGKES